MVVADTLEIVILNAAAVIDQEVVMDQEVKVARFFILMVMVHVNSRQRNRRPLPNAQTVSK